MKFFVFASLDCVSFIPQRRQPRVYRPLRKKHMFRSKHIFACVSGVSYKTEESGME